MRRRTTIGITSRRPSHIRPVITIVEKSLNGSNEPSGPPTPKAGPTFESMLAETETASNGESSSPVRAASIARTAAPMTKMPM